MTLYEIQRMKNLEEQIRVLDKTNRIILDANNNIQKNNKELVQSLIEAREIVFRLNLELSKYKSMYGDFDE